MSMKNKGAISFFIIGIFLLILIIALRIYCTTWRETEIVLDTSYSELFSKDELDNKGHISELPQYATDVSIAYENEDGSKTLYVYSSPIRYLNSMGTFSIIDTRIANVRDNQLRNQNYIYTIANSDIKSFYPKEIDNDSGILIKKTSISNGSEYSYEFGIHTSKSKLAWYTEKENFISKTINAVQYKHCFDNSADIYFYPSTVGTNCEINFRNNPGNNKIAFWLQIDDNTFDLNVEPGGYIVFKEEVEDDKGKTSKEIRGVIQKPLLKDRTGIIHYNNSINLLSQGDGLYIIEFCFDENVDLTNSIAFISFEIKRENQPDNSIYSKDPDLKYAYLRNYSVIGNTDDYGIGRLLIRYKFTKHFNLESKNINKTNFHMYSLNQGYEKLELLSVLEDWCSITGNWNKKYKTGEKASTTSLLGNEVCFDITEEVKKWCDDKKGKLEHNGLLLKTATEEVDKHYVLLSNDCSLYNNYTEINFK